MSEDLVAQRFVTDFDDMEFILDSLTVEKANPYRDASTGRFTTGGVGGGAGEVITELPEGQGYEESDPHPAYDFERGNYIETYTGKGSDPLNQYLRLGVFDETNEVGMDRDEIVDYKSALDGTLSQTHTVRDMTLFRGIGSEGVSKFENLKVGDTFTDKGYCSTTSDPSQLWDFLPAHGAQRGAVLEISVPKGSKVLSMQRYFDGVSPKYAPSQSILDEAEHLLPRNTLFKVTSIGETRVSHNSRREGNEPDLLIKVEATTRGLDNVG